MDTYTYYDEEYRLWVTVNKETGEAVAGGNTYEAPHGVGPSTLGRLTQKLSELRTQYPYLRV